MEISIIIVNFNTKNILLQCIKSIYKNTNEVTFEIIVVDNNSSDDSCAQIKKLYPKVILVENKKNVGFGRANNIGLQRSSGEYIFLLNSDTQLINNAAKYLRDFLLNKSEVGIVGGQLFEANGVTPTHSYSFFFPSLLMEVDIFLRGFLTRRQEIRNRKYLEKYGYLRVAFITGADMMLRRTDAVKYGLFNPEFFLYYEETELCYRYFKNGRLCVYYPEAKIIHLGGSSFSTDKARSRHFKDGRDTYFKIVHSIWYKKCADIIWNITLVKEFFRNKLKTIVDKYR